MACILVCLYIFLHSKGKKGEDIKQINQISKYTDSWQNLHLLQKLKEWKYFVYLKIVEICAYKNNTLRMLYF